MSLLLAVWLAPAAAQEEPDPSIPDPSIPDPSIPDPSIPDPSIPGTPVEDLFDDSVVEELRLFVHSRDWQALTDGFQENTYYPADLHWRDQVVRNIGIRSRGGGTRDRDKPGLRLDFNRYASGQTFFGRKSLVLDNARQDGSFIRERLAMLLFERMGLPAPRETHVRLYVNNDYIGLYILVESIDKAFLARTYGERAPGDTENDGYLYEYKWGGWRFEYLGPHLDPYAALFSPRTHESASIPELFGPIEEMVRTVNDVADWQFAEEVGRYLDLRLFLRHLAVESYLAEHDGVLGYEGMNNFYFYRFEERTDAQFIPWDKDLAFFRVDRDILEGADDNVLVRRALAQPDLWAIFEAALRECVAIAGEPLPGAPPGEWAPGWLEREVDRLATLVRPAAQEDQRKVFPDERFEEEINLLVEFARSRGDWVLFNLARFNLDRPRAIALPAGRRGTP